MAVIWVSSKRPVGYLATELQDTGTKTQDTGQSDALTSSQILATNDTQKTTQSWLHNRPF